MSALSVFVLLMVYICNFVVWEIICIIDTALFFTEIGLRQPVLSAFLLNHGLGLAARHDTNLWLRRDMQTQTTAVSQVHLVLFSILTLIIASLITLFALVFTAIGKSCRCCRRCYYWCCFCFNIIETESRCNNCAAIKVC